MKQTGGQIQVIRSFEKMSGSMPVGQRLASWPALLVCGDKINVSPSNHMKSAGVTLFAMGLLCLAQYAQAQPPTYVHWRLANGTY